MDWHRPLGIWQVADEGQQPLIGDIQMSEFSGLPFLLWLVSGSLPIFAQPLAGLKRLLPLWLIVPSRLARDHGCLSRYTDIILQG